VTARKDRGHVPWSHAGAVALLPDNCWLSARSSCRARAFPLRDASSAPNLSRDLASRTEDALGAPLEVETFALWALAFLCSPRYRASCDAALRLDYPRIPAPRTPAELAAGAAAGRRAHDAFLAGSSRGRLAIGHHDASVDVDGAEEIAAARIAE
jgi:hypothetical protein